jgi:hypothetical protein
MDHRNIQIPPFIAYLQHTISLLWERFNKLLGILSKYASISLMITMAFDGTIEMNVESVRASAAKYSTGPKDTRPNSVCTWALRVLCEISLDIFTLYYKHFLL